MELLFYRNDRDIKVYKRIQKVMRHLSKEGVFSGSERRLTLSWPTILICEDGKDIGFLYFAEENYGRLLSVDMGIINEYRGRGIALKVLKSTIEVVENNHPGFIVAEVKTDNLSSLGVVNKLGGIAVSEEHYLLQPNRLEEFKMMQDEGLIRLGSNFNKRDIFGK